MSSMTASSAYLAALDDWQQILPDLRVLAMSGKQPKETLRIKLESCRENIELATPGIVWQAPSSTLNLDWLQGPMQKGMPESRVIRIDETGHPR